MSLIGRTLSRYEILEEISRGGMGIVYRARDVRLNREVALKVLPADLVADPARRARFVQEAQAASSLEHPHIAVIHEIDEADGISFIAMELVRGEKLSDLIGRGPLPAGRALDLATEIAEGLARAHDKGVVHRDLKPANVMLTEDGHAKIIDFGLAKLVDALSGDSSGQTVLKNETDPGMVLGTVTYMSPEQARGGRVDHRSDIFSFGVLLHEMITGRPPFRGNTGIDTIHAILHDPVPPLPPLGPSATAEATGDVQRLLEKCLAKDPDSRYQGMRDVVVDLRAARRRLESTTMTPASAIGAAARSGAWTREGFMDAQKYAYGAVALVVALLAGFGALKSRWTSSPAPAAPAAGGKPSVAVLYFENNTGNSQLDWLRTGLTDMLVTDLSQSPDVEVLPTDRLVQILGDMRRQDDRAISFDTVQEIAKRAGVKSVLLGSYMKAGDTIRINIKLQEASTGKIVTAERVEAANESALFPTMDDLTRRFKNQFAARGTNVLRPLIASPADTAPTVALSLDRDLKNVTTSSIEAYRYYVEGLDLHNRDRDREAVPLLEKAIAIDPQFAMALTKLAVVENNLQHLLKREEYAKRALEHVDRLSARERYYIEGYYYSNKADGFNKAIEAYKKAIELYPDHASARHNLALLYNIVGREADSVVLGEELRRRGMSFPTTYANLATAYLAANRFDKATEVLQEYSRANPTSARGHAGMMVVLSRQSRWDEALAEFDKAAALEPPDLITLLAKRNIFVATDRWADLSQVDRQLLESSDPAWRFNALMGQARDHVHRGLVTEALRSYNMAIGAIGPRGSPQSAAARMGIADLYLETGQAETALVSAQKAVSDTGAIGPLASPSLSILARVQERLGHRDEAEKARQEYVRRVSLLPDGRLRQIGPRAIEGALALERHDSAGAIQELKQAEDAAAPGSQNALLYFQLATAYLDAGRDADAASRFERITGMGVLRANDPLPYVHSFYFLGAIADRLGDRAKAADYYRRFLSYWGDGEIDRDRVAEARRKLSGSDSR